MRMRHVAWFFFFAFAAPFLHACAAGVDSEAGQADVNVEEEEQAIELFRTIRCKDHKDLIECMIACGKAGVGCSPNRRHPFKDVGMGNLDSCRTALPKACIYRYSNNDICVFPDLHVPPICLYG